MIQLTGNCFHFFFEIVFISKSPFLNVLVSIFTYISTMLSKQNLPKKRTDVGFSFVRNCSSVGSIQTLNYIYLKLDIGFFNLNLCKYVILKKQLMWPKYTCRLYLKGRIFSCLLKFCNVSKESSWILANHTNSIERYNGHRGLEIFAKTLGYSYELGKTVEESNTERSLYEMIQKIR